MMNAEEMKYHMPGWIVEVELGGGRHAEFRLWAPTDGRPGWSASWDVFEVDGPDAEHPMTVEGTERGDFRGGSSMGEVLAVFDACPDRDLAARARRLLTGAARGYESAGSEVRSGP